MTAKPAGVFSRPVLVARLPPGGLAVEIAASAEECTTVARQLGLPAIRSLGARYRLVGRHEGVRLTGRITAEIAQICVVSLDEFETRMSEDVELDFIEARSGRDQDRDDEAVIELDTDEPDEIVDGRVDLGTVTAEFLALGLDPYPKKPGAAFEPPEPDDAGSPFARLAELKARGE